MSEKLRKKTCCCANRRLQACQADIKSSSVGAERVWEILQTTRNKIKKSERVNYYLTFFCQLLKRYQLAALSVDLFQMSKQVCLWGQIRSSSPWRCQAGIISILMTLEEKATFIQTRTSWNGENWHFSMPLSPLICPKKKKSFVYLKHFKFCRLDLLARSLICKEEGMLCLSNLSQLFTWFHFFGGFSNIAPAFSFSQALPPVSSQVTLNALLGIAESVLRCNYLSWQRSCASCLWSNIPSENSCTLPSSAAFISDCLNSPIPREVKAKRRLSHVHAIKTRRSCAGLFNGQSAGKFWASLSV